MKPKVGQIWQYDDSVAFRIKILSISGHTYRCEVVNRDVKDTDIYGFFVKGYITTFVYIKDRYTLYCTRYEEK